MNVVKARWTANGKEFRNSRQPPSYLSSSEAERQTRLPGFWWMDATVVDETVFKLLELG
jgi:hypothetical protein